MLLKVEAGKRYGKLLVTDDSRKQTFKTVKYIMWLCKCDCGTERWFKGANLRAGRAMSCGCARAENPEWGQKAVPKDSKYFFKSWLNSWRSKSQKRESKKHMLFTITLEELDAIYDRQSGLCYYTGRQLIPATGSKYAVSETNISLDRIDNNIGYTYDNIVLCTKMVNVSRNIQTQEEYIQMCKDVAEFHKSLPDNSL